MKLDWTSGLKAAYSKIGATQRDQYSWIASTQNSYVFTVEIDHIHPADNIFDRAEGYFLKNVPAMDKLLGNDPLSISHSKELLNAVSEAYTNDLKCRLLIVKGTKFGTSKGGIKAADDGHLWQVTEYSGDVKNGYSFRIERVA